MENETIAGPVNVVAPHAVRNGEFAKTLGGILSRPTCILTPSFAVRAMFEQMATETILSDVEVMPVRLLEAGFEFAYPTLNNALEMMLR